MKTVSLQSLSTRQRPQQTEQLRLHCCKGRPRHGCARMNYDVPSRGDLQAIPPQDFSDAPANSIADHRASQRLLHADAEAASRAAVGAIKNHELRRGFPCPAPINCFIFGTAYQASGAGKPLRHTLRSFKWA